ncbi:MAG: PrsW family glutamic-type intramembrane protease [Spirochaetes bacterium]|nr:PrsW family glutamic-type intramembrane protease [Spirochaetota bacterium]
MIRILPLIMAVVPALFLLWYFYRQDRAKPEPKGLITLVFFMGIVSVIPVIILELGLTLFGQGFTQYPLFYHFFHAFIVAGFSEEFFKMVTVRIFAYHKKAFDEVMDGIVYTIVASLGFACFENIMYVAEGGMSVAILRAFSSVPLHAFCSGIMGYYFGKAKFCETPEQRRAMFQKGLMIGIFIHGLYNFLLFISGYSVIFPLLNIPLLIISFIVLRKKIKAAIQEDRAAGRIQT